MKSQYYKQVEMDTYPRKQNSYNEKKKKISESIGYNIQTHSRNRQLQKKNMISSIDLMKKSKQQNDKQKMKMSYTKYSKPIQVQINPIEVQWIDLKCMQCQNNKIIHIKRIKQLQMVYQQQLTQQKQKYIFMQKKYLLKQNQFIKLIGQNQKLQRKYQILQNENIQLKTNNQIYENNIKKLQLEINKLNIQNKNNIDKIQSLHKFLKLFLEQTKIIINWAHLFQKVQQDLIITMTAIKDDLLDRKFDFQVTFKQAATFQRINFSQISINKNQTSPFIEEDSGCQNFMKYLKQENIYTKSKCFTVNSSNKKGNSFIDSINNKENIDYINGISIKSLINSRLNDRSKQKSQAINDDCLRLLLIQAKAIQSSKESKIETVKKSSRMLVKQFEQSKCSQN